MYEGIGLKFTNYQINKFGIIQQIGLNSSEKY